MSDTSQQQSGPQDAPTIDDVRAAADRVRGHVHRTPVHTSSSIDAITGTTVYFKCENLQKVGAFKFRGATNAISQLTADELARGVATHSSGNHAQALARAAAERDVAAYVVMPDNSPAVKVAAVKGYGAKVVPCAPTLAARESTLADVVADTGATFIHPYNDPRIIAGQGTAALELLEQVGAGADADPPLDIVMTPVGGGGLLSGTAIAVTGTSPKTAVVAAEPEGADDAYRSLREGRILPSVKPNTVCEGLLTSLGTHTFAIIQKKVTEIVTVSDPHTIKAMRLILERLKLVVEPSAAVCLGALLEAKRDFTNQRVGIILSGGNADFDHLPWLEG